MRLASRSTRFDQTVHGGKTRSDGTMRSGKIGSMSVVATKTRIVRRRPTPLRGRRLQFVRQYRVSATRGMARQCRIGCPAGGKVERGSARLPSVNAANSASFVDDGSMGGVDQVGAGFIAANSAEPINPRVVGHSGTCRLTKSAAASKSAKSTPLDAGFQEPIPASGRVD